MHKLKLVMDDLRVESFDTTTAANEGGTVFGEQCTCYSDCTCPGCPTCDGTCPQTCPQTCDDASCAGSCWCPSQVCEFTWGSCTCPEN